VVVVVVVRRRRPVRSIVSLIVDAPFRAAEPSSAPAAASAPELPPHADISRALLVAVQSTILRRSHPFPTTRLVFIARFLDRSAR
jgi:hypothetical protein